MEQGDQIVKISMEFMAVWRKYFSRFSVGKYKGEGDKKEVYPHEGKFTRSSNIYHRHISPESKKYEDVVSEMSKETKNFKWIKIRVEYN